jgi:hypothetical protein
VHSSVDEVVGPGIGPSSIYCLEPQRSDAVSQLQTMPIVDADRFDEGRSLTRNRDSRWTCLLRLHCSSTVPNRPFNRLVGMKSDRGVFESRNDAMRRECTFEERSVLHFMRPRT